MCADYAEVDVAFYLQFFAARKVDFVEMLDCAGERLGSWGGRKEHYMR